MTKATLDLAPDGVLIACRTDVGQVRTANEDSCAVARRSDGARLLVVADGMGGHRGGATASQTAATLICETFKEDLSTPIADLLRHSIETANAQIYEQSTLDPELEGMGTTVVAFAVDTNRRGFVAHVGDSRAYRDRENRFEALTSDHSVVAEMEKRGLLTPKEAAQHPRRNEILRSVGVLPQVEVDSAQFEVQAGDRFLLCSDGLTGLVEDAEIAEVLRSEPPDDAADALVHLANERGGLDNITVEILTIPDIDTQSAQTRTLSSSIPSPGSTTSQAFRSPSSDTSSSPLSSPSPHSSSHSHSPSATAGRRYGFIAALALAAALLAYYFTS